MIMQSQAGEECRGGGNRCCPRGRPIPEKKKKGSKSYSRKGKCKPKKKEKNASPGEEKGEMLGPGGHRD